jgi:SAM-dependent methyltransferase
MTIDEMARRIARIFLRGEPAERRLSPIEEIIYNEGERLIPGITHDRKEHIRHRSSYEFFCRVIEGDLSKGENKNDPSPVEIIDLGCGVGHGCHRLAKIPGSRVTGVDASPECIEYAERHYGGPGITYRNEDLARFIPRMPAYDYAVSRGVFEHIPGGLALAVSARWNRRLMFDVPYDEVPGPNPHHVLTGIREEDFHGFPGAELFYQDLDGIIYDRGGKPPRPNMIVCICTKPGLPMVGDGIPFPLPAWQEGE